MTQSIDLAKLCRMYESDLFRSSQKMIESCLGFRQLFKLLPPQTEIAVSLEERIPCALTFQDPAVHLAPREASGADLELVLFPESIRRLSEKSPDDLLPLLSELTSLTIAGHAKIRLLSSPAALYKKGYVDALKALAPEIQREVTQLSFVVMAQAAQAVETIKSLLKR